MASSSPKIGKLFGIDIELHWTFLLLVLFALLVSVEFFVIIVLLFICVLIHELAHSVTSQRNHIKVKKIVLLPIGGASIIDETKIDPRVEFNIALAGPVMSFLLGGIFGIAVIFSPPGYFTQLLQFLFEINVLLAVFNILPAFPMDGGRVLRSYLQRKHNFYDATNITVKISDYIMILFLLGTFAFVAFATSFSLVYREFVLLWDVIIVAFLYGGAQGELEAARLKKATTGLTVFAAVSKKYIYVEPGMTLNHLYELIRRKREHLAITRLGGAYAYVNLLSTKKLNGRKVMYVSDVAEEIPSVGKSAGITDALSKAEANEVGMLAVVDRGKLIGIATVAGMRTIISLHALHATINNRKG